MASKSNSNVQPGAKFVRIMKAIENPAKALKQIGVVMVAASQGSFRNQSFGSVSWPARSVPNVMGIIADFAQGKKTPPKRRFDARPALMDTGRLAASISYQVVGTNAVEIGSVMPYASLHQSGGVSTSKTITQQVRNALGDWLRGAGKPWRKKLGWLMNPKWIGKSLTKKVPARPFVGVTPQVRSDIARIIGRDVMESK